MSNMKFAAGVILAGALAFGGVFAAHAVTAPMLHGIPAGSSSGQGEPTEEAPVDNSPALEGLLVGRWQAAEPANQDAFVEFSSYGIWTSSDGCNQAQGSWSVEDDGTFDGGEGGAMTMMWCDNVNIPTAVWGATTVEVTEHDELVLTSEDGEEMLLVRASTDAFMLDGSWVNQGKETSTVEFTAGGDWVGTVGCAEFTGTWMLGVRDVPVLEDESAEPSAPVVLSGPANLLIGPKPADAGATCAGAPQNFVLEYDTEYLFWANEDGSFSLTEAVADGAEVPMLEFVRG